MLWILYMDERTGHLIPVHLNKNNYGSFTVEFHKSVSLAEVSFWTRNSGMRDFSNHKTDFTVNWL